ncbi:MAG: hypothetical protein K0R65_1018 [Crocinitomicaceae bacterium]|jgi:hypothetical protein|nr:hypothetical protein [Crocinitomicaceae bacterium]
MKKLTTKTIALLLFITLGLDTLAAEIISNSGEVSWSSANSWNLGRLPLCGDVIIIPKNSTVLVNNSVNFSSGDFCERTQITVWGKMQFTSGKKVTLHEKATVSVFSPGEIHPSKNGGGNSETIEIGKTIFWKAGDGTLKGKALDMAQQGASVKRLFDDEFERVMQRFTLENSELGGTIYSNGKVKIVIAPNSLKTQLGQPVTGSVNIELIEMQKRSGMLMMNKPTIAQKIDGSKTQLITGGEFYLRISQNNSDVVAETPVKLAVIVETPDDRMSLFDGVFDTQNNLAWTGSKDDLSIENIDFKGNLKTAYTFPAETWGWINIDRFMNDPREKKKLSVKLPAGFSALNTVVLIAFKEEGNSISQLDMFENGRFTEHYGLIPVGSEIHVISLSNYNGGWLYGIQSLTVAVDTEVITIETLTPVSTFNLTEILNEL